MNHRFTCQDKLSTNESKTKSKLFMGENDSQQKKRIKLSKVSYVT